MGVPDRPDPSKLRISDADRNKVAEVLRDAAGDGRITLDELDARLDATWAARTYADLVPITADLPTTGIGAVPQRGAGGLVVPGKDHERAVAIMGGVDRRGVWVVPQRFSVLCLMGGANLDLRQAHFAAPEVTLHVSAIMGGADIVVNRSTHVIVDGIGIMGGFDGPRSDPDVHLDAGSPVVRVKGFALMGGVTVRRKGMPGENALPGWRRRH